ncbi:phosphohexomutase domain-containing protein [Devosia rhizoryzae]|uniref:Phosphomannomutase n=1 Tax=Devosia rhizoryzae TaxID=2774137 RepID=A0ABX7C828_9HYPH|nr:phosphomannomutase [Devosia rhizoryzae]QQR40373.1 phosphomannomutase [Devosia rhizoryzae]
MSANSLKFGTSGLRGLSVELQGQAARRYTRAFIDHLRRHDLLGSGTVFIGRDFRPSSPSIARDCAMAIAAEGLQPVDCGTLPTPALALHAMAASGASIMVTGSHIPADRNGLKFYRPDGEISKDDEAGIIQMLRDDAVPDHAFETRDEADEALARYVRRYEDLLPEGQLRGLKVGVFEHSTVARDLLGLVLRYFGAETLSLGRIEGFVPVDTEAFSDDVFNPLRGWLAEHKLDAIVSADGDGDRPLLMDGRGAFVRGDVLGLLTARFLEAQTVVTPVTSNSGIERTGSFERVVRTRVGSPYVVAAMSALDDAVVGFEANGGTFIGKNVAARGAVLSELATRDAVLPVLCVLGLSQREGKSVDEVVAALPLQHALSDRLQNTPSDQSAAFLRRLEQDRAYAEQVFALYGIAKMASIDGLQVTTTQGDMVHFRASGNAPELRCYVEGASAEKATELLAWGLATAAREVSSTAFSN